ncbi:hypothetical protein [Paenibacillus sedimenti]|uniref:Uncharacterized protein n=1 Tax=Paenibacillus sedimenti TaxID=2770274 RepID=A0A926KV20_9BACL|nr:hypothetical protein [Paenibacillus sedimenti]MBD0383838.1 hypothetical protein [Paenibacillus sedimenti]
MNESEFILVGATTKASEQFIYYLKFKGLPFAVVTNNKQEQQHLSEIGADHAIVLDTTEHETWIAPKYRIGKIFLFESSLSLCCRYLQIIRKWSSKPVYVITERDNARFIYKGLGADHVIYSKTGNVSFLLD